MLRMKGGAVREARSPLKDAIDCRASQQQYDRGQVGLGGCDHTIVLYVMFHVAKEVRTLRNEDQEPLFCGATPAPSSLDDEDMLMLNEAALRLE